jgi:hypothetical protein
MVRENGNQEGGACSTVTWSYLRYGRDKKRGHAKRGHDCDPAAFILPMCIFCHRHEGQMYAVTSWDQARATDDGWERSVLEVCPRCRELLSMAGSKGLVQKTTRVRWWLGHGYGLYPPPGG